MRIISQTLKCINASYLSMLMQIKLYAKQGISVQPIIYFQFLKLLSTHVAATAPGLTITSILYLVPVSNLMVRV